MTDQKIKAQWVVGLVCAVLLAYMLYLSGGPDYEYDSMAILGMLLLIALLLEYRTLIIRLAELFTGRRLDDIRSRNQAENDDEN